MVNILLFNILAFGLIVTAIAVIFSRKIYSAIISAGIFFLFTGLLYLILNSVLTSISKIIICGFMLMGLLISAYRQISKKANIENDKSQFVKKSIVCFVLIFTILAYLTGLLVYYFTNLQPDEVLLYSVDNTVLTKGMTFFINLKTVFVNYILAYELIILSLFTSVIGVGILISQKKEEEENNE